MTAYYENILRPGDVVIDIGANLGVHALLAAHLVGPEGRVHAIEASPTIFGQLKHNLYVNRATNVIAYNVAVSDRATTVPVFHDPDAAGLTTILSRMSLTSGVSKEADISARPLAEIVPLSELRLARLIKIDVEGAEWLVVAGIKEILPTLNPKVEFIIEITPYALEQFGVTIAEFVDVFATNGFTAWRIPNEYSIDFYTHRQILQLQLLENNGFQHADVLFRKHEPPPRPAPGARS